MVIETKPLLSDKVRGLRESLLSSKPQLCCERLTFLKEVYAETEGEPTIIRRARLYDRFLQGKTIFIDDNPIVGTLTKYRVGVMPFPEASCSWMKKETRFSSALGTIETTEEQRQMLREAADYWERRCVAFRTKEVWAQKYGDIMNADDCRELGVWRGEYFQPKGRICLDYGKVLNKGFAGVIREAEEELRRLPLGDLEAQQKRNFLNAVIIAGNAVVALAQRYASLARDTAQREPDPERRRELAKVAETCQWVPQKPARSFYEAIQSFWFVHLAALLERNGSGYCPGRFSQYMYPFYKKDKEEGNITESEALELLELLFIRFTEVGVHFESGTRFTEAMGSKFQNISLGGVTPEGKDATNDIDFLLLEAQKRVRLIQPTLSILFHNKMSDDFLLKAAEVVGTGIGMPAFFNNDLNIQSLLNHGASLEDARNHCIIGCVERGFSRTANTMAGAPINIAKFLELALNNGRDALSGKQLGPKTGEATAFRSYGELCDAVKRQFQYFAQPFFDLQFTSNALHAEIFPTPFASALVDDCIKKGKDIGEGGSRYSMDGCNTVGTVDLANSLAAIKKLVFEEKRITMVQLLEALRTDFDGHEEIHRLLLDAPKYGNDDDYVDEIVREWFDIYWQEFRQKRSTCHLGRPTMPIAFSVSRHFPLGAATGALPSGRKARLPLTDGSVSAMPGTDKKGPTALIRSAAKVIDTTKFGASLLNMKFHPSALKTRAGLMKLIALVKTYVDWGGHHVQFNVVSADTLREAQLHPEKYRDLIVRVAGFSAFFVQLDPKVQDEIIKRSELRFD